MSATRSGHLPMLSSWAVEVGAFLGDDDLRASEQAGLFCPLVLACLWEESARRLLSKSPLWGAKAQDAVQRLCNKGVRGKIMIAELRLLQRTLFLPKAWTPWICPTCFNSVKAVPGAPARDPAGPPPALPEQAGVAVATGAHRGQPLVVGMTMASAGSVGDAACVGIEAVSSPEVGVSMSVSFAPFTGRCFIQHPWDGPTMQTQALPTVHGASSLVAWIQVTEDGGVRFLRQVDGGEPEEVGLLPPEMFPKWIRENFACIHFWGSDLKAEVQVSIEYSGATLPAALRVPRRCPAEMQTVWEVMGAEEWA
mmetsp:Transcript_44264/g.137865  ORF Transcript_44264/g.137865 Transcript_44264/m.137865 type:complete len:309 (+) Transcript_44264:89-1015(+)|eukprot:CAMPEP_0204511806 /NCGR_PEP_ID=MMETSP0661-20131031/624_1 /ASSEMBLY_ACC=CAM_ASM_000606 /TAXON_ID=109239 /ORGANISM="Alexandrium margalefi, Strain AMGDE01CS-322" /LENGTH=308 /DNA_ID=CAMNT_0051516907 /DNA_START=76 /DNA_END=1002 /DNA_ORIENTATION=+